MYFLYIIVKVEHDYKYFSFLREVFSFSVSVGRGNQKNKYKNDSW